MSRNGPETGGAGSRPALAGRVVDAGGKPVAGAFVMFTGDSPEHQDIAQVTNAEGRFFYPTLSPGRYSIFVRGEANRIGTAEAVVGPGLAARVEITLEEPP